MARIIELFSDTIYRVIKTMYGYIWIGIFALVLLSTAYAQTKNPDISIVTDFRAFSTNNSERSANTDRLNMNLEEIELALQGYLNPYARADIFISKHGIEGPVEIEEAAATFLRGLPWGLEIKVGKYLVDFGKLNTLHPHAFYFVERPLVHRIYFGPDGFNDTGINLNFLLPTEHVYSKLSFNVLKGDFVNPHMHEHEEVTEHDHEDEDTHEEGEEEQPLGYSTRLSAHMQVSDFSSLELGVNGATGIHDPAENLRVNYVGADIKYKWVPSRYTSLTLQTEYVLQNRETESFHHSTTAEIESVTSFGYIGYTNLQFKRRWNIGLVGEWLQAPDDKSETYWSGGLFAGFSPMEETSVIRLLLKREKHPHESAFNLALVQVVFSLGPHRPHVF